MRQLHILIFSLLFSLPTLLLADWKAPVWMFLSDPSSAPSLAEIRKNTGLSWQTVPNGILTAGFSRNTIWLRTDLHCKTGGAYTLELANLPQDEVTLYLLRNDGRINTMTSGTTRHWNPDQARYHNLLFSLQADAGEHLTLYLQVRSAASIVIQPKLYPHDVFEITERKNRLWVGLFIGVFCALGFYSLMIWAGTRDRDFLNYFLYIVALGLLQCNLVGILHEAWLYQHPDWMAFSRTLLPALAYLAYVHFSRQFLNLRHFSPRSDHAFRICGWAAVLLIPIYAIWGNYVSVPLETAMGLILISMGLFSGFIAWSRGFRPARFYLLAKAALFAGGVLFILATFGTIPASLGTLYGFHIGGILETFLIAFSLSDKINTMQREHARAQNDRLAAEKKVIETLRESEAMLEERVKERTGQLEDALILQKTQAEALLASNQQLHLLNEDKNAYMGVAAHDLKNPTSAIIGFVDLLTTRWDTWETARKFEKLANIRELAVHINEIIRKLLDVNAIESGCYLLSPSTVDLEEHCARIINEYTDQIEKKNLRLEMCSSGPIKVKVDRDALLQILDNLVSNAIKYSPQGLPIYIQFSTEENDAIIQIRDEGPGISQEEQGKLFKKFMRLSARPTGGEHSSGLGLYIVKRIVESSGGQVYCESRLGEGTSFIVRLPLALEHNQDIFTA